MFQVEGVFLPPQTPPKKRANTYSSYHLVYHIFGCAVSEVNIRMDWNMKLLLVHILACVLVPWSHGSRTHGCLFDGRPDNLDEVCLKKLCEWNEKMVGFLLNMILFNKEKTGFNLQLLKGFHGCFQSMDGNIDGWSEWRFFKHLFKPSWRKR